MVSELFSSIRLISEALEAALPSLAAPFLVDPLALVNIGQQEFYKPR